MKIMIKNPVGDYIIERLYDSGFTAYYVGGCIRNSLLGEKISDYDIATSATPEQVLSVFSFERCCTTGIKHGTVGLLFNGDLYEVTTFREEGKYSDRRRPDEVRFCTDIHQDLSRRDFTINAMAYNKIEGLIDDFNGVYDTHNLILRTVGDPCERFNEDALRILRAVRFIAGYNLYCEKFTYSAILKQRSLLLGISRERIFSEFKEILLSDYFSKTVKPFKRVYLTLFPGLGRLYKHTLIGDRMIVAAAKCISSAKKDFALRLAVLLFFLKERNGFFGKPDLSEAKKILDFLKADNLTRKKVLSLLDLPWGAVKNISLINVKLMLMESGVELDLLVNFIHALSALDNVKIKPQLNKLINALSLISLNDDCYTLKQLNLKGEDVVALGFYGPKVAKVLDFALREVIKGNVVNEKKQLITHVTERYD